MKKEFIVKEQEGFRLKIRQWKAINPNTLNSIEFVQECLDKDGQVDSTSTYNFLMTDAEVVTLANQLMESIK